MARNADELIRQQIGALMVEVAILTSANEALTEQLTKLREEMDRAGQVAKPAKLVAEPAQRPGAVEKA